MGEGILYSGWILEICWIVLFGGLHLSPCCNSCLAGYLYLYFMFYWFLFILACPNWCPISRMPYTCIHTWKKKEYKYPGLFFLENRYLILSYTFVFFNTCIQKRI